MKGNYDWLSEFFYTHMSTQDYETMINKVEQIGGDDEVERNKAQDQYLYDLFLDEQKKSKKENPREVSQRKGVATMIKKMREKEDEEKKTQLAWIYSYNRLEPSEARAYTSDEIKNFITSKKDVVVIEKDEQQLADTIMREYNQKSKDEPLKGNPDANRLRELITSETKSRILPDKTRSKITIDDFQKDRDLLIANGELRKNELKRIINKYNAYKREQQGTKAMFNEFQGSPEYVDLAMSIRNANRDKKLNDKQVFLRVYDKWKSLYADEIQEAEAARLRVELVEPAKKVPELPNFKKLAINIRDAREMRDMKGLEEIESVINSYKVLPAYSHRQNDLENLWNRAESAKIRVSGGLDVEPKSFTRVLGSDVSGRELNDLMRGLSERRKKTLQNKAFSELYPVVKQDFLDSEINRRVLQLLPGSLSVEEKLKGRMGVRDEKEFVDKVIKLDLDKLERNYGTEMVADVADLSKTAIIDGILGKTMPKAPSTAGQRSLLIGLDREELLSMAATQGVPIIKKEDKISRSELKSVKQIAKARKNRFL